MSITPTLRAYFYSGWAFFIPYLLLYLLYCWQNWPVNQGGITQPALFADQTTATVTQSPRTWIPALFNLYRALHLLHASLGILTLYGSWNSQGGRPRNRSWRLVQLTIPWCLLALIIGIPGVYWEFPNDTWEHYLRINDWHFLSTVTENSGWRKFSYFFAYTLCGGFAPAAQQVFLAIYCAAMGLLLCWQYYLLALNSGLSQRASFLFVVLQYVIFGNNIFNFYRYYGLSSTVVAQIAAIAFIRLAISVSRGSTQLRQLWSCRVVAPNALLLALMAFSHIQSLGVALLGVGGLVIHLLHRQAHKAVPWLLVIAGLASLGMIVFWPRAPVLEFYRQKGWLNIWYGFDLLDPSTPAAARGISILGGVGVLNLMLGIYLAWKKHLVGWLTVFPILALLCPVFSIPFAEALARSSVDYVIVFHRMLLSIPAGLAIVVVASQLTMRKTSRPLRLNERNWIWYLFPILWLTTVPANQPYFNRFWHTLVRSPNDSNLSHITNTFTSPEFLLLRRPGAERHLVTNPGLGFATKAMGIKSATFTERLISYPTIVSPASAARRSRLFLSEGMGPLRVFAPRAVCVYTPISFAAQLSGHWLPQEIPLQHAAGSELSAFATRLGWKSRTTESGKFYLWGTTEP